MRRPRTLLFEGPSVNSRLYLSTANISNLLQPVASDGSYIPFTLDWITNREMRNAFLDLLRLTAVLSLNSSNDFTDAELLGYSDRVYFAQKRLIILIVEAPLDLNPIDVACCIVANIFVDVFLRAMGLHCNLVALQVTRTKMVLEAVVGQYYQRQLLSIHGRGDQLVWLLVIGGVAAIGKPERSWFVAQLVDVCEMLGIISWSQIVEIMRLTLWHEAYEIPKGSLWHEVERERSRRGWQ